MELLLVVAIIAILSAILIPNFLQARARAEVAGSKANLKNIATALESFWAGALHYPDSLDRLQGVDIRVIPNDPCTRTLPTYTPNPTLTDYRLSVDYTGTGCANVLSGVSFTPGGGMEESP